MLLFKLLELEILGCFSFKSFSKCASQTSNINITGELIRNAKCLVPARSAESETLGLGLSHLCLPALQVILMHTSVGETLLFKIRKV